MKIKKLSALIIAGVLMGMNPMASEPLMMNQVAEAAQLDTLTIIVDGSVSKVKRNAEGILIYRTVSEALKEMERQEADNYIMRLNPGTYREKVTIRVPNLTMIGNNATIIWNDAEGTKLRPGDVNADKDTYTMECATVKLVKSAKNFQAIGVTFANDFETEARRADKTIKAVQALAITNESEKSAFYDCKFIGRQDTIYANYGRQYYKDCYIEGDVDFIFGQATAVFENCEIKCLNRAMPNDGKGHNMGYVAAPSTLEKDKGFLIYKCHLISDVKEPDYYMLGRPWHPSSEQRAVNSAVTFRECVIDVPMKEKGWNSMGNKYGTFQPEDNRLYEYKNTGKGAKIGGNRRQLTDKEAKNYTVEKFLGDWKPKKRG